MKNARGDRRTIQRESRSLAEDVSECPKLLKHRDLDFLHVSYSLFLAGEEEIEKSFVLTKLNKTTEVSEADYRNHLLSRSNKAKTKLRQEVEKVVPRDGK
ncbi:hypothetical protein CDAR_59161 [Caerostris darwini]|uniref:Uncharacterized protein n=1 Tax=Caerostris darwini TaxID=1538125 RepID=A0AAV4X617_9ARAC|nr:hypothetical protein CDAR_59161 [Caerostris darwini]